MKKLYSFVSLLIIFSAQNISAQINGSDTVCSGEKVTYYVPSGAGSYSWNISGGTALSSLLPIRSSFSGDSRVMEQLR